MNWDSIKSILKLSIPLIISQLGLFFVQLSDTVMVGQIGSRDLAAISFGGNVYFFIYIFGIGIVSVGVIHDGVSTTIHREVLQSATLWVVSVEGLSTVAILQVCALLELVITDLAHIVVAVRLIAMHLFKLTTEIVRVSDFLLIRINHLQQTVVAVVSPLRHVGCYRLVRHNHRAAGLRHLANLAIEILNGTCSVLAEHQSTDMVLRGVATR